MADQIDEEELVGSDDEVLRKDPTPAIEGEESISGSAPDPVSDDNTLDAAHDVGLRLEESEEEKKPLNTAEDVAAAERALRGPPEDQNDDQ